MKFHLSFDQSEIKLSLKSMEEVLLTNLTLHFSSSATITVTARGNSWFEIIMVGKWKNYSEAECLNFLDSRRNYLKIKIYSL